MSLINDALKRARQAQSENPPATPPLEFRPVEPNQHPPRRPAWLGGAIVLAVIAVVGLTRFLNAFMAQSQPTALPVAARVVDPAPAPVPPPESGRVEVAAAPVVPADADWAHIDRPEEPNTNGYPVAAVAPAVPKLQGIFFQPRHPSVVIDGRTLYLGDRWNGYRVIAISPVAATLVNGTSTNVLSLSGE